ncbi:MAG: SH3 domain-containing protein [Lachnospiraceae bacterium]|nr:SH3 domain-containing protein [Lachnospiraceae bacterium]
MRHNRRAVMTERYKLYMRKNIFNGRYFVRNVQIALCAIILIGLVIGGIVLANSGTSSKKELAKGNDVSALDALFGNSEEITTEEVTEATTEEAQVAMATEATEATTTEEPTTEPIVAYTEQTTVESQPAGEFDSKCIANVEETLNVRSTPSAEGEFVGSMNPGAIAIVEGTEGDWTKIKSGDVEGYVLSQYVLTGESAEEFAKDYVTLQGTALEDGVNVRTEQSTDANIVTVLNKDDTITVLSDPREEQADTETATTEEVTEVTTQEASSETATEADTQVSTDEASSEDVTSEQDTEVATQDSTEAVATEEATEATTENTDTQSSEITWLPVMLADGETGYVSADLVDIDRLYEIAVSADELQRREEERLAAEQAAAEAAALAAQQATQTSTQTTTASTTTSTSSSSSSNTSYQGATTTPVTATSSGECIGTFTVTAYCGCEKCSGGHNKTASGTTPTEGRTIAADTSILPFGSQVVIDGVVYTVEDRGSGVNGNHIDIFFATHDKAMAYGSKTVKVYKY